MPKYAALVYATESEGPPPDSPEMGQLRQAYFAYLKEVHDAGIVWRRRRFLSARAARATATTVRMRGGNTSVSDGPVADSDEQLGGYFVFDRNDLDEATEWAAKLADAAGGSVGLRPNIPT